jgi:hypothetical protein
LKHNLKKTKVFFPFWEISNTFLFLNLQIHSGITKKKIILTVTSEKQIYSIYFGGREHILCSFENTIITISIKKNQNIFYFNLKKYYKFLENAKALSKSHSLRKKHYS